MDYEFKAIEAPSKKIEWHPIKTRTELRVEDAHLVLAMMVYGNLSGFSVTNAINVAKSYWKSLGFGVPYYWNFQQVTDCATWAVNQ